MRYRIESSAGVILGTYEGATPREAIEAMWRDAGWSADASEIDDMRAAAAHAGDAELAALCASALAGDADSRAECETLIRDTHASDLLVIAVDAEDES